MSISIVFLSPLHFVAHKEETPMLRQKQRGFTLIELLVVIAIIATLVALLLPAVQQAREAARRSTCKNSLKQIGLALHNYHDTHGVLPSGSIMLLNAAGTTYNGHGWTWHSSILPFLDQGPMYDAIQGPSGMGHESGGVDDVKQGIVGKAPLTIFWCPSQPDVTDGVQKNQYAPSNYNGNIGTLIGNGTGDDCYNGSINSRATMEAPTSVGCLNANGIFYPNSSVRFRDVTDGLSNTFFVSEVIDSGGDADRLGGGGSDRKHGFSNGADGNPPSEMSEYLIATETNDPINGYAEEAAGSYHKGGAQFAFGDGSVHFLSENMDMTTYRALSTRDRGETVGEY